MTYIMPIDVLPPTSVDDLTTTSTPRTSVAHPSAAEHQRHHHQHHHHQQQTPTATTTTSSGRNRGSKSRARSRPDWASPVMTMIATSRSTARTLTPQHALLVTLVLLASSSRPARATSVYLNRLDTPPQSTFPSSSSSSSSSSFPSSSSSLDTLASLKGAAARPSPSDKLPIEDLLENPDQSLDPTSKHLNPRALRRILGSQLDREFLSVEKPLDTNDTFVYDFKSGRPDEERPAFLGYLRTFRMADGQRVKLKSGRKQRRRLQKLVWSFTYCPVQFTWKDLGLRFWPRWLREGTCWNGRPCSMPPGMSCKPSSSVNKTLLRWHCKSRRRSRSSPKHHQQQQHHHHHRQHSRRRPKCRWIPMQYPIVTKCSCAC